MSDLRPDGKYLIVSYADPKPSIGADNIDNCAVKPVITDGQMRVWSIKDDVGGVFQLVLEDTWYSSHEGDKVVVKTSVDPGTRWVVIRVDHGDGVYQIISTDHSNTAWTATVVDPESPVVLSPLADPGTNPLQLWKLIPVLED